VEHDVIVGLRGAARVVKCARPREIDARRPRRTTVFPVRRGTKRAGSDTRRSGRRATTFSKRAPSITGCSARRTVSTSGSSGKASVRFPYCTKQRLHDDRDPIRRGFD
jgi:hypothetical protein